MISKFKILLILTSLLFFWSCGDKAKKISKIVEVDMELQMNNAFKEGYLELQRGDVILAAKKFNEAELLFPQSPWAAKSAIMAAYAYYTQSYYSDSIFELERYLITYPKNKDRVYAHFLLGMTFYEKIVDEKKDLKPLIEAEKRFELIIKKYPLTDFAQDAEFKIEIIKDVLSSKEMYLAKHYIKKEKWIPAINRLKIITEKYETTIYVEEALLRLVEIHYKIGLIDESKKYASLLGYNYLSGEWYKESYKIFNKNYKDPVTRITKEESNSILKKLRLFKIFGW